MLGILQWYAWSAPKWLVVLTWNMERACARYFSAGLMVRTLVAHWHKDRVSYKQGTLSKIILAFSWNMISRAIGFIVRTIILALYILAAVAVLVIGIAAIGIFFLWPVVTVLLFIASIQVLGG